MDIQGAARKAGREVGRILSTREKAGPDTDILDLLQKDHDEIEDLLAATAQNENRRSRRSGARSCPTCVPRRRSYTTPSLL